MSFNRKIIFMCGLLCVGLVFFGLRYYRSHTQPPRPVIVPREEVTLTIIPGWTLRQVADYLVAQGFASTTKDVYRVTGEPAMLKSQTADSAFSQVMKGLELVGRRSLSISHEGYLAPETYRVFRDATLQEVIQKLLAERNKEMRAAFPNEGDESTEPLSGKLKDVSVAEVMTMASIIEKETRAAEDRPIVADILWRRYLKGWALQVDSSVHYVADRTGDVFTTDNERAIDSPWNTYKYPGLPPGPICNPSVESINAALHPEANRYWYFLTGTNGQMYYAATLDEHNSNRVKYLR